jgi:hypothetical protein
MPSELIRPAGLKIVTWKREPAFVEVNLNGMEKDQMKKLVIFVLISALLTFTAAKALAHDDDNNFKHFHGTYEMIASGSCIHSSTGYTKNVMGWWIAPLDSIVYAGTTVANGTWIFKRDGTGTYSSIMYATVTPPVQQPSLPILPIPGSIRVFKDDNVQFKFKVNAFGDITINEINNVNIEYTGSISIDKKQMILIDTPFIKGPFGAPFWSIICNTARTLIKVSD